MVGSQFRGIIAAVITPFDADGTVNLGLLAQHVEWLIDHGVHGVMVTGTAGEFASLSDDERLEIAGQTMRTVRGVAPQLIVVTCTAEQ